MAGMIASPYAEQLARIPVRAHRVEVDATETGRWEYGEEEGASAGGNVAVPFSSTQVFFGTPISIAIGAGVIWPVGVMQVYVGCSIRSCVCVSLALAGAGACRTQNENA